MHTQLCSKSSIKPLVLYNNRFSAVCTYIHVEYTYFGQVASCVTSAAEGLSRWTFSPIPLLSVSCSQMLSVLSKPTLHNHSCRQCMYIRMCTVNNVSFPFLALFYADKCVTVVPFEVRPLHTWALSSRRCWHRHEWNVWILQERRGEYDWIRMYVYAVY